MKKIVLTLLISFSLVLVGCNGNLKSLSVMEAMNKDLIEDIKEESKELLASYNNVDLLEMGLNKNRDDLEIKFKIDQDEHQESLEKLSNLIMDKLKDKLDNLHSRVTISWDYNYGEKISFYNYSIDENMDIILEETYLEEAI